MSKATPVAPLNVYGQSKAEAERARAGRASARAGGAHQRLLRPVGQHNFVTPGAARAGRRRAVRRRDDLIVSPTYVPDLVDTCLDLMIDGERGIWHLTNGTALSWAELARRAATLAGVSTAAGCRSAGHRYGPGGGAATLQRAGQRARRVAGVAGPCGAPLPGSAGRTQTVYDEPLACTTGTC